MESRSLKVTVMCGKCVLTRNHRYVRLTSCVKALLRMKTSRHMYVQALLRRGEFHWLVATEISLYACPESEFVLPLLAHQSMRNLSLSHLQSRLDILSCCMMFTVCCLQRLWSSCAQKGYWWQHQVLSSYHSHLFN